jgi:hypothetical protein
VGSRLLTILRDEHVAGGRLKLEDILNVVLILLETVHVIQRGSVIISLVVLLLLHAWLREYLLHLTEALLRLGEGGLHLLGGWLYRLG